MIHTIHTIHAASSADRLLAAVEPLPHAERLRTVARTAHALAATGELAALLDELEDHGTYGRRLAALAAQAGRHTVHLTARLADPDPVVRRYAQRAIRRLPVPDEAVERAVLAAPTAVRGELVGAVLRSGRSDLAERLVTALSRSHGPVAAAPLLPLCSPGFVAVELPAFVHAVAVTAALGHRHPQAVLDAVEPQLAARASRRDAWARHARGLAAAARHRPLRMLDLLERWHGGSLSNPLRDRLADLVDADAERTVRLLITAGRSRHDPPLRRAVARRLAAAAPPSLTELAHQGVGHDLELLRALPPGRRTAFHDAAHADTGRRWAGHADALALLPAADRYVRARAEIDRLCRATDGGDDSADRLIALLPPEEARPQLLAGTGAPDPEDRAHAWRLLIRNAGLSGDPAAVQQLLTLTRRLRNEQDLVRRAAPAALVELSRSLRDEHAPDLHRLAEDALTARDCSDRTRAALTAAAVAVLGRHHAGTALADWAGHVLERTGAPGLDLPRASERAVVEALRPSLHRSAATADATLLLAVAEAAGPRTRRNLADLLIRTVRGGSDPAARRATALLPVDPAALPDLLALLDLLERDAAQAGPGATGRSKRLDGLTAALAAVRTDLVDRLLTAPTPPDTATADRWTPRQQQAAAAGPAAVADDPQRPVEERAAALRAAARIPGHGAALLRRWAGHPDTVLAETALAALPTADDPAAVLPDLLARAAGDRARVALHAADRAARHTPPGTLAALLRPPALGDAPARITSRKQAVRLAARHLPAEAAATLLLDAVRAPDGHPDVRTAALAETLHRLGDRRADDTPAPTGELRWALLAEIAAHGTPDQRRRLTEVDPHRLPPADHPRYAELVAGLLESGDRSVEDAARTRLADLAGHVPQAVAGLARTVLDPDDRHRWESAAETLAVIALGDTPHPLGGCAPGSVLSGVLTALAASVGAGEDRSRERLARLQNRLFLHSWNNPNAAAVCRAAAAVLLVEPALRRPAVELLVGAVDVSAEDLGDRLVRLLADRPALAVRAAEELGRKAQYGWARTAPALAAARRLAPDGSFAGGVLAVALARAGARDRWSEPWRALLHELRRHPEPDVRDEAHTIRTDTD
ncbi:hypothetical protein [Kitasatospora sp. CB02891]|uniref:hypothetical protein n=1 Tax=Kitasatospora sp. CB02891 TaxID=2020329 RepID=UPI000C27CAA7|nr:hypothetical protein [Kitasatospora sp. CB02891]PJN21915.1 hypothetical protein CG736_30800 [Kitasatospora sp. CB02891]